MKKTYFVAKDCDSKERFPTIIEAFSELSSANEYAEMMEKTKGDKYIILSPLVFNRIFIK